jgi:hypothetical protein
LLDMERKAFKIVENVAGMAEVVEKGESNSVG